jgi:hypothetical protein
VEAEGVVLTSAELVPRMQLRLIHLQHDDAVSSEDEDDSVDDQSRYGIRRLVRRMYSR